MKLVDRYRELVDGLVNAWTAYRERISFEEDRYVTNVAISNMKLFSAAECPIWRMAQDSQRRNESGFRESKAGQVILNAFNNSEGERCTGIISLPSAIPTVMCGQFERCRLGKLTKK